MTTKTAAIGTVLLASTASLVMLSGGTYSDAVNADAPFYYAPGDLTLPHNSGVDGNPSGDFTVEAIVSTTAPGVMVAAGKHDGWSGNFWLGTGIGTDSSAVFSVAGSGGTQTVSGGSIKDGERHHVVGVREGQTLRLYVDGVEVANTPTSGGPLAAGGNLYGGCFGVSGLYGWSGTVGDLAYYFHALTPEQVTAHFAAMGDAPPDDPPPDDDPPTPPPDDPPPSGPYTRVDAVDAEGNDIMVLVPASYDPAVGAPLVIYHHGAGETCDALLTDNRKSSVVTALLSAGYILCGTDAGGEQNWGNQAGMDSYTALYAYMVRKYRITDQGRDVVFLSQSMGGLTGLLCLADQRFPCKGWYGVYPVCSLEAAYSGFASYINPAYGITDPADYAAATAGHDPMLVDVSRFPVVPYRFTASHEDSMVPQGDHSDPFAARIVGLMPEAEVINCTGNHGDPSHFLPDDVVEFFGRCLE